MKKLFFIPILFTLTFCTAIRQLGAEKVKEVNGCSTIVYDGKKALIELVIDQSRTKFVIDTGAGISALIDSTVIDSFEKKKFGYLGYVMGADRKKTKNRFFTAETKSDIFISKNKVLTYIKIPESKCSNNKNEYTGIIGIDFFFNEKNLLQLDFSNNKICNIHEDELQEFLSKNPYRLVKSLCKSNQIFIFIDIEGKEYKFKLDTGYTGNIIMPYNDELRFKNDKKLELEGSLFQTISSHTSGSEILYEKMPVTFASNNFESKVNVSTSIKAQNVGIDFIKAFDWLIDYNNNKVYVKRNQNTISSTFNRKIMYYAKVINEKLEIVVKEKSQIEFKLGDQIISVNGQKVTKENQCEMQDLLNKTEDWSSLQIEVLAQSK